MNSNNQQYEFKKKIIIVGAFPPPNSRVIGGVVSACKALLSSSFSSKYHLILIDSTQISNPPPNLFVRSGLALKRFLLYFVKLIHDRPDLVLIFASKGASLLEKGLMAWMAKLVGVRTILFPRHGDLISIAQKSNLQLLWIKSVMRGADYILCQGPSWKHFAMNLIGFTDLRTPIVYNWTATDEILSIGESRELQPVDIPTLLFLGWLEESKGIFDLLTVCQSISRDYKFRLLLAGRGHAEESARDFVKANKLNDFIQFVGWVSGMEKTLTLQKADILVLPSWKEGFPNSIIEAMAAKVAVIVTAVGNVPDLLADKNQVLLVPARDTTSLEASIKTLLMDDQLRFGIAERGYQFAKENFSVEKGASRLVSIIENAV